MKLLFFLFLILTVGSLGKYDVIVVRSDIPADWIIAHTYSQGTSTPIVATSPEKLDANIKSQLLGYTQFGFNRMLIIGGEKAVSLEVQQELETMGFVTHRISEADRYSTSARVAVELFSGSENAVLANGEKYETLLVAGEVASRLNAPILLIRSKELPLSVAAALEDIKVKKIFLVDYDISQELKDSILRSYTVELVTAENIEKISTAPIIPIQYFYLAGGSLIGILSFALFLKFKKLKHRIPYTLLTEDEEKVVRAILENGGEITQDKLPEKTDFSRPKISRIVSDLANRGIISKGVHGRTQKLIIQEEFYESGKKI